MVPYYVDLENNLDNLHVLSYIESELIIIISSFTFGGWMTEGEVEENNLHALRSLLLKPPSFDTLLHRIES